MDKASETVETQYPDKYWQETITDGSQATVITKHIFVGTTRICTALGKWEYGSTPQDAYWYHDDHIGSTSVVTDTHGEEYERLEYSPYGETWVEDTKDVLDNLNYAFSGKELDRETGLYYYGARYLDPRTSAWLSADPALAEYLPVAPVSDEARKQNESLPGMGGVFNPVNLALYHYAGNSPVRLTDDDGEFIGYVDFLHGYLGWNECAPQSLFGYSDDMDDKAHLLNFNIDGTRFDLHGETLRLWKGDYGMAGGGGEIGFYSKPLIGSWGLSKSGSELLFDIGLYKTTLEVYDSRDDTLIGSRTEYLSFWTTIFNPKKNPGKDNVYTINTFTFIHDEQAKDFIFQIKNALREATRYKNNRNQNIEVELDGKKVIIIWGKESTEGDAR